MISELQGQTCAQAERSLQGMKKTHFMLETRCFLPWHTRRHMAELHNLHPHIWLELMLCFFWPGPWWMQLSLQYQRELSHIFTYCSSCECLHPPTHQSITTAAKQPKLQIQSPCHSQFNCPSLQTQTQHYTVHCRYVLLCHTQPSFVLQWQWTDFSHYKWMVIENSGDIAVIRVKWLCISVNANDWLPPVVLCKTKGCLFPQMQSRACVHVSV